MQLKAENIGKRYHTQWIFRHIGFELHTGQSLSITGKNGSGKSTLIQIVYGLMQASEGKITIDGNEDFRASFCFSLTSPYMELPFEFSISELHALYKGSGKMNMELDTFLEYSQFTKADAQKAVKLFSSGMLQRLKTAFCFASVSPVLLLDEPLTNMDKGGEVWYKNCLNDLKDRIIIIAANNPTEYAFAESNLQLSE